MPSVLSSVATRRAYNVYCGLSSPSRGRGTGTADRGTVVARGRRDRRRPGARRRTRPAIQARAAATNRHLRAPAAWAVRAALAARAVRAAAAAAMRRAVPARAAGRAEPGAVKLGVVPA